MKGTVNVLLRNVNILSRFILYDNKSKTFLRALKCADNCRILSLAVFAFLRNTDFAFKYKCIQYFHECRAVLLADSEKNGDFLSLHRYIHLVMYKVIYYFFSFFK